MAANEVNPTVLPEENLKSHILLSLIQISRDVENWPHVETNTIDHALYKLEHIAITGDLSLPLFHLGSATAHQLASQFRSVSKRN